MDAKAVWTRLKLGVESDERPHLSFVASATDPKTAPLPRQANRYMPTSWYTRILHGAPSSGLLLYAFLASNRCTGCGYCMRQVHKDCGGLLSPCAWINGSGSGIESRHEECGQCVLGSLDYAPRESQSSTIECWTYRTFISSCRCRHCPAPRA